MLRYELVPDLPRLAGAARVTRGAAAAVVRHGPWLETHERFFAEGAWTGEFGRGGLADATVLVGSGGVAGRDGVVFAGPTHTLERLQVLRTAEWVLVSNSLTFLLAEANDAPDPFYWFYDMDIIPIICGLKRHRRGLPTRRGATVSLFYHCNIRVDRELSVHVLPKPEPPAFRDYRHYVDFLREGPPALRQQHG